MTRNEATAIHIRIALLDLGRDSHIKLPKQTAALDAMFRLLRIEQKASKKSKLIWAASKRTAA